MKEANTNDSIDKIAEVVAPLLSQHTDEVYLNEKLFSKVKVVEIRQISNLDRNKAGFLEEIYKRFVRGGANLATDKKEEFKKINTELSLLELNWQQHACRNQQLQIGGRQKEDLAGLPESVVAGASDDAKANKMEGKWVFTLQKPSWIPFLTYSEKERTQGKIVQGHVHAQQQQQ